MKKFYRIVVLIVCLFSISACQNGKYGILDGVTFIAPLGKPPINYIEWSPVNQNEILVTATYLEPGLTEVYILDIESMEKKVLISAERGGVWGTTWLPGGKSIVVVVNEDNKDFTQAGYWAVSISDGSREFLRKSGEPFWSPDGDMAALYTLRLGSSKEKTEVLLLEVKTNKEETILSNIEPQRLFGLSWSPDGQKLAYSLGDYTTSNLYIIDLTTRAITQLTKNDASTSPVWSPSGDVIAYHKTIGGVKSTLHLIKPDGTCDIEIFGMNDVRSPTWSPDGKKLGFVSLDGIYYLEIDKVFGEGGYQSMCVQ